MKAIILTGLVLLAQSSFARCFDLVKSESQQQLVRIGNIQLAAPAERICLQDVRSYDGTIKAQVTLSDSIGDLAQLSATELSRARCGHDCGVKYMLEYGNANGVNVNASGISIAIETKQKSNLGNLQIGTLTVQAGRDFPQTYLISGH